MNKPVTIQVPALLGGKIAKTLRFETKGLHIERPSTFAPPVFLPYETLEGCRFGVKWIKGYAFTIGRTYFIELKTTDAVITTIKLKSFYRIKKNVYHKIWNDVFEQLWIYHFGDLTSHYLKEYKSYRTFELAVVKFLFEGIGWENNYRIPWENIALSNYRTYFVIHPRDNPRENKSLNFANDWNAYILQRLLKEIIGQYKTPGQS